MSEADTKPPTLGVYEDMRRKFAIFVLCSIMLVMAVVLLSDQTTKTGANPKNQSLIVTQDGHVVVQSAAQDYAGISATFIVAKPLANGSSGTTNRPTK
jgi:hypothetical protein